jgi:hypothetical protein
VSGFVVLTCVMCKTEGANTSTAVCCHLCPHLCQDFHAWGFVACLPLTWVQQGGFGGYLALPSVSVTFLVQLSVQAAVVR